MIAIYQPKQLIRQTLTAALLLCATLSFPSRSFAATIVSGCGSGTDITLKNSNNWTTLCSVQVTLPTKESCVLTGSAEVHNDVTAVHNEYKFTVDKDNNPVTPKRGERLLDVTQGTGADPQDLSVSPLDELNNLAAGTYTFHIFGRKATADAENITVTRYTLGVVCSDGK